MRVCVTTFGCRLNQFDSDALERQLEAEGHEIVASVAEADVHVINTCTITHVADGDARKLIRRSRRDNPDAAIVVTGCYATSEPDALRAEEGVALVLDNQHKSQLTQLLNDLDPAEPMVLAEPYPRRPAFDTALEPAVAPRRTRAFLKVQDGCNYACAFCIVPQVRGRSRSLPVATAQAQMRALGEAGFAEVVLTGVHLGTYGRDLEPRASLPSLLTALFCASEVPRLRLGSVDPHEVSEALIRLWHTEPRLCRHLHLATQSLDDDVLTRMRRAHRATPFMELTHRLTREIPGMAVSTDIIVGHPGETEAAFMRTYDRLAGLPLAYLHVFTYSPRRDTAAAAMADQVPDAAKRERSHALRALSAAKQAQFATLHATSHLPCVVLRRPNVRTGAYVALSDNDLRIHLRDAGAHLAGKPTWVHVDATEDGVSWGHVVSLTRERVLVPMRPATSQAYC